MKWSMLVLAMLMPSVSGIGQVPQLISHQGYIADSNGVGITNSVAMTFNLYTDSTAGSLALTQLFPAVTVTKGIFNINLDVSSITFGGQYWLETEIAGEVLSPRTRLTSAPYSLAPWGQNGSAVYYTEGKVGIGTTSPSTWAKLHVAGGDLTFDDDASRGIMWINGSTLRAHVFRWSVDSRLYVTNNGTGNLTGVYLVSGGTSWISTSDRRLKENIGEARYGLGTVMRIPVREYNLKGSHEKKIGFVAQELYPIVPEIVSKGDDGEFTASSSPWGIDYAGLTPILVKSIQEQQQQIEKLVERLTELEARLRHAESRKPNQE